MATVTGASRSGIRSVGIQGEPGSFSYEAALALAPAAMVVPCALSLEVFERLVAGEIEAAVIPIENSLAGSVLEHYDLLLANDVRIEGELLLRIRHNLIAPPGRTVAALTEVYSHPIALAQCRRLFREHPQLRPVSFYDTAGSVKHVVAADTPYMAAIASQEAALAHGGVVLLAGIEDNAENYTRFLLIRRAPGAAYTNCGLERRQEDEVPDRALDEARTQERNAEPGHRLDHAPVRVSDAAPDKVSLCFGVENRPGSLVAALQVFAEHGINLIRLESRPVPGQPWHYIFYADYQVEQIGKADEALAALPAHCSMVRELGRYRAATPLG